MARLAGAAAVGLEVLGVEVRGKSAVYDWEAHPFPAGISRVHLTETSLVPTWKSVSQALAESVIPFRPDALAVPGWSSLSALAALAFARRRRIPVILMSESNADDCARHSIVERMKSRLVGLFAAGLVGGRRAEDYLVQLGMPPSAVFLGYDAVDNDYFISRTKAYRKLGAMPGMEPGRVLPTQFRGRYFLSSARFIQKKNLFSLLEAYALVRSRWGKDSEPWPLVILGDGALRSALAARRAELALDAHVHMPGFKQYSELPAYYGTAGAFVLTSTTEQWGLVVNEAMASGLPVAVSRRCGSAETLVVDGENGVTFEPDPPAIADALLWIARHVDRDALSRASLAKIAQWGPERFGRGLSDAAVAALSRDPRPPGVGDAVLLRAAAEIQARRS